MVTIAIKNKECSKFGLLIFYRLLKTGFHLFIAQAHQIGFTGSDFMGNFAVS